MNSERTWNKSFYLLAVVIILAIVSIAASVIFINSNSSSVVEVNNENTSSNSSGGGGGGGDGGGGDGTSYPFRIFFTKGIRIYSTKTDGTDLQNHYELSKSGLRLYNLITSNSRSKLLFYDKESIKVLKLAANEIDDLGIKSEYFSLSSDDKKLVCISGNNPNELSIFDIETKKLEFSRSFSYEIESVPQYISNNSEIIFKRKFDRSQFKMVKLNITTGYIENLFDDDNNMIYGNFKLSPDGKLLAFVTRGMCNSLKIYDFESKEEVDDFRYCADLSILQWSPDSKSIYLSHDDRDDYEIGPELYECRLKCKKLIPLMDENGEYIKVA